MGLLGALREHVERLNGQIRFSVELPDRLPPLPAAVEVAAYRIALEALTNVTRHADASACTVRLSVNGVLALEVQDDGRGLAPGDQPGIGLASMRERAAELGGECRIERADRGGTRVNAFLPLERS